MDHRGTQRELEQSRVVTHSCPACKGPVQCEISQGKATCWCFLTSVAMSWRRRPGSPSPTRTIPAGPSARCTTSMSRLNPTAGVDFHSLVGSMRKATSAEPTWPSYFLYVAAFTRRIAENDAALAAMGIEP